MPKKLKFNPVLFSSIVFTVRPYIWAYTESKLVERREQLHTIWLIVPFVPKHGALEGFLKLKMLYISASQTILCCGPV